MDDWQAWLADVSNKALPGGVTVAAMAAAMGAALATKALRVTLLRGGLSTREEHAFQAAAAAAREVQTDLVGLAEADDTAFRRLLATSNGPAAGDVRRKERIEAWDVAIETPLRVSETCRGLVERLSPLHKSCSSAVLADLEIGQSLLLAGAEAGNRAARANLREWKAELRSEPIPRKLARRLEGLEPTRD